MNPYFISICILLIAEFIIVLYLYNNTYCGSNGSCELVIPLAMCVMSPDDKTINVNSAKVAYIFNILIFVGSMILTGIYIALTSYDHKIIMVVFEIMAVLMFAFNLLAYDTCLNGLCDTSIVGDRVRCTETHYLKKNVYGFYVAICVLFSLLTAATLKYVHRAMGSNRVRRLIM